MSRTPRRGKEADQQVALRTLIQDQELADRAADFALHPEGAVAAAGGSSRDELAWGCPRYLVGRPFQVIDGETRARRQYVCRARCPTDRRRNRVGLTDAGREAPERLDGLVDAADRTLLEPLSAGERGQLIELLSRLVYREDGFQPQR